MASQTSVDIYDDGDYARTRRGKKKVNTLLVKHVLGKSKSTVYDLPPSQYVYGKKVATDDVPASAVVQGWKTHRPNPEDIPGRDFARLNRRAVVKGCTTSKDIAAFRRTHDIRLRNGQTAATSMSSSAAARSVRASQSAAAAARKAAAAKRPAYGRPSGEAASMDALITNRYQKNWLQTQRDLDSAAAQQGGSKVRRRNTLRHTNASRGHHKTRAPAPAPRFQMSRFANVPNRVSTLRGGHVNGGFAYDEDYVDVVDDVGGGMQYEYVDDVSGGVGGGGAVSVGASGGGGGGESPVGAIPTPAP